MSKELFALALGISDPWFVGSVDFDATNKVLTVLIDFKKGSRFAISDHDVEHPVHDTVTKAYRHLNFFQHECQLQVLTPRVKLPDGSVRLVEPDFAGRLNGFTLLFEAFVLMLSREMPFSAVARIVGESGYKVLAICEKYVDLACEQADYSMVTDLAIDETSRSKGHDYVTLGADAEARRVIFVGVGRSVTMFSGIFWYVVYVMLCAYEVTPLDFRLTNRFFMASIGRWSRYNPLRFSTI